MGGVSSEVPHAEVREEVKYTDVSNGVTGDILPPPTLRLEVGASWDLPANVSIITKLTPSVQRFFI